jgi:hypothetical protein
MFRLTSSSPAICADLFCGILSLLVGEQVASKALALKEWAPLCEALGTGDQMIVVRKGGIREKAFRPAASKFLLFPTGFHTDAELLRADARDKYDQVRSL